MQLVAALGGGSFVLMSLVVGARLLLLARRTHGTAELSLGLGLLLIAGLGYPLMMLARFGTFMPEAPRLALLVLYQLAQIIGIAAISSFNWRVFRPHSVWAAALTFALTGGLVLCFLAQLFGPGLALFMNEQHGPWTLASPLFVIAMGWSGVESLHYHALMRRRLTLGLADVATSDRFGFWAASTLLGSSMSCFAYAGLQLGVDVNAIWWGQLTLGILGFLAASSLSLAFLPPRRIREWRDASEDRSARA